MKTATNTLTITKSEAFATATTTEATINRSAAAYHVLSNSLYSDKILAVCREVICNALDISIKTNTPEPVLVTLPTRYSEQGTSFAVRDFGTGLSEDEVRNLALTYFGSNKSDSNNEIGGFGLGFKAPLAYSDSFHVISYQQGQESLYVVYFNDDRIPVVTKLAAIPTDKPDGLEVVVPVKAEDISSFEQTVEQLVYFIPKKLLIVAGKNYPYYLDPEPFFNTPHFVSIANRPRNVHTQFHVLMGMVRYPIRIENLPPSMRDNLRMLACGYLKADIGTLNLAPSREALSYDRFTLNNLDSLILKALAEVRQVIRNKLDQPDLSPADISALQQQFDHLFDRHTALGSHISHLRQVLGKPTLHEAYLKAASEHNLNGVRTSLITRMWRGRGNNNNNGPRYTLDDCISGLHHSIRKPHNIVRFSLTDRPKIVKLINEGVFAQEEDLAFIDATDEQIAIIAPIIGCQTVIHWSDRLPPAKARKPRSGAPTPQYQAMHLTTALDWVVMRFTKNSYQNLLATTPIILRRPEVFNSYCTSDDTRARNFTLDLHPLKRHLNSLKTIADDLPAIHFPSDIPVVPLDSYDPKQHTPINKWLVTQVLESAKSDDILLAGITLNLPPEQLEHWGSLRGAADARKIIEALPSFLGSPQAYNLFRHAPPSLDIKALDRTGGRIIEWSTVITNLNRLVDDTAPLWDTVQSLPPSPLLLNTIALMRKYPDLLPFMTKQHDMYLYFAHYFTLVNNH